MDPIASASIKYGGSRTRELLFTPFDRDFYFRTALHFPPDDRRNEEMKRLKPYYRGTRLITAFALLMVLPAFLIPFTSPFLGFNGALMLIFIYVALLAVMSLIAIPFEAGLDAVLALRHETGSTLSASAGTLVRFAVREPVQAIGYMGVKLLVDMGAMTLVMLLYLPAMYALIWLLSSIVRLLGRGAADVTGLALGGLVVVAALALAAGVASALISVPLSAFYGYYTEEAIRRMKSDCCVE